MTVRCKHKKKCPTFQYAEVMRLCQELNVEAAVAKRHELSDFGPDAVAGGTVDRTRQLILRGSDSLHQLHNVHRVVLLGDVDQCVAFFVTKSVGTARVQQSRL